jgi:hypothetical protein
LVQLAPAFFSYLPWLNVWWGLQIVLDLIVLAQRHKQPLTDWFEVGLDLVRVLIFFQIVLGPAVVQLDAAALARLGASAFDAQKVATANEGIATALRVGLGIATALGAVNLVRVVYRRLFSGRVQLAL